MNTKEIKQAISELSICDDGKRGVYRLVQVLIENISGVKLNLLPRRGEVWFVSCGRIGMILNDGSTATFDFVETDTTETENQTLGYKNELNFLSEHYIKCLAANPMEYFANREKILSEVREQYGKKN